MCAYSSFSQMNINETLQFYKIMYFNTRYYLKFKSRCIGLNGVANWKKISLLVLVLVVVVAVVVVVAIVTDDITVIGS